MPTTRYTRLDGELISEDRGGVLHDYVSDPLGNTIALLDDTQTQTDQWAYFPYGESVRITGSTDTPMLFVGSKSCRQDSTSTMSYMEHRILDMPKARFITEDSIGFGGEDWNQYQYVSGNPVTHSDPSGLGLAAKKKSVGNGGIGKGKCPVSDAVKYLRKRMAHLRNCAAALQTLCGGHSLTYILTQITFETSDNCLTGAIACTRFIVDPFTPGKHCKPGNICIDNSWCKKSANERARVLVFELGNWCNCKYGAGKSEAPARSLCLACGFRDEQCRGATMPKEPSN